ncbi:hypothetical protein [Allokutzneria albata]|uniref:DUF4352 domain-containing protein n=1 Tax=Allokutzneria albata TaxID=211114 RepID=A0A1H0BZ54_ALLAB|nr:hypothetical protein [Allokutzneria albata]SDN50923.1 hypothetical protein SAMN04489726_6930 [Allokutzneria albata]
MSVIQLRPTPTRFGGLAVASLVLGVVGVCGSPVLLLNNATAVAAAVGLVLGAVALFGSKKVMAGFGVGLSVLGIALTLVAQNAAARELEGIFNGSTDQRVETVTWGKRHTWRDGLAVEVSAPTACKPGPSSAPASIARAVKFTVTITNGTDKPFETAVLSVGSDAQFNGRKAEAVFDHSGGCGGNGVFSSATVLPGKTYTYDVSYSIGADPGEMQLTLRPSFGADKAVFAGRV